MAKPKLRTEPRNRWDKERGEVTVIETGKENRYSEIPEKDFESLMDLYDSLPHPNLQTANWRFVADINFRIFTEWCMSPGEGKNKWDECVNYQGEGFTKFVGEQTHLELVRKGYQWNEQEKRFENINDEQYQQARKRVLGGLTLRAIELFSDWNENSYPPSRGKRFGNASKFSYDSRNLRTNLEEYITRFDLLSQQKNHQAA